MLKFIQVKSKFVFLNNTKIKNRFNVFYRLLYAVLIALIIKFKIV